MSTYYEAKIGYGYVINGDDYPEVDYDNEESINAYEDWCDDYHDCRFRIPPSFSWDCDAEFFGIILKSCDCGEYRPLDEIHRLPDEIDEKEWAECEKEFHRLFPNSTQEPNFYLMSCVW